MRRTCWVTCAPFLLLSHLVTGQIGPNPQSRLQVSDPSQYCSSGADVANDAHIDSICDAAAFRTARLNFCDAAANEASGKYEQAVKAYSEVLRSPCEKKFRPLALDGFNRSNQLLDTWW
jgi:hypothetical protein